MTVINLFEFCLSRLIMNTEFARNINVNCQNVKYDTINILSYYTKHYNYPLIEMIDIKDKHTMNRGHHERTDKNVK